MLHLAYESYTKQIKKHCVQKIQTNSSEKILIAYSQCSMQDRSCARKKISSKKII